MAEGKKSFVLYCDIAHTVTHLTDQQAGKLFKHIIGYVNDDEPSTEDIIIKLAFEPIKQQLKRDLRKWEHYIEKQRYNGHKGGRPQVKSETQITQAFLEKPKKADSVTVNVNDNVNVKEEIYNKGDNIKFSIEHCLTVSMNDERWVRNNKASPEILKKFNLYLEGQGVYEFNPMDYKKYFHHWNKMKKNDPHLRIIKSGKSAGAEKLADMLSEELGAAGAG